MMKKVIGIVDINDVLLEYQEFLINRGSKYVDMILSSGKYGFSKDSRYPIKVGMTNKELFPTTTYPFLGVEEFLNMVLVYSKHTQDNLFFKCVRELSFHVPEIKYLWSLYEKTSWRSILEDQMLLFGETMSRTDEMYVESLIKNVMPRLPLGSGLFNDDVISYVSSGPNIEFITYGSVYKLFYLRDDLKVILNFEEE